MSMALQYKTIRNRLIDPPVKLTREVLEEKNAKIASLCRTIRVREQMHAQQESIIERLKEELLEAQKREDALRAELRKAQDRAPSGEGFEACEEVVNDVMKDWPDLTMTHIRSGRRSQHVVAARYACIFALADCLPDMPLSEIARFMGVNESIVRYAIKRHREAMEIV